MNKPSVRAVLAIAAASLLSLETRAQSPLVSIETVVVGDVSNTADTSGYGAVSDLFAIGKFEVTIGQYTAFLNSVAASDPFGLFNPSMGSNLNVAGVARSGSPGSFTYSVTDNAGSSANRPISYVSWFDAARFVNWINNGATNGASTETGAYTLNGATNGDAPMRNESATWWIPTENEWYKAAYYKGGGTNSDYWIYPTQSDDAPGNTIGGDTNQANYYAGSYSVTQSTAYSSSQNYLTEVGAFSGSDGAYGTFDQGGNVWEWNDLQAESGPRGLRGGRWGDDVGFLQSSFRNVFTPDNEDFWIGFRVATVPEPSTYALLLVAGLAIGARFVLLRRK